MCCYGNEEVALLENSSTSMDLPTTSMISFHDKQCVPSLLPMHFLRSIFNQLYRVFHGISNPSLSPSSSISAELFDSSLQLFMVILRNDPSILLPIMHYDLITLLFHVLSSLTISTSLCQTLISLVFS